jgi:hypothetical protein
MTQMADVRRLPSFEGALPNFLIIGAQKAGTTALYHYLCEHPMIFPAGTKEVHFFDREWDRGVDWYRTRFPRTLRLRARSFMRRGQAATGEATPYYLAHPLVPSRARSVVPDAKLVAVLRDPVERAFSHYRMTVRKGHESLDFESALEAEAERIGPDLEQVRRGLDPSPVLQRHGYAYRGFYAEQLERWHQHYAADQMLVLAFADLVERPSDLYARILGFLDLEVPAEPPEFTVPNRGDPGVMSEGARERLRGEFASSNRRVKEITGIDLET